MFDFHSDKERYFEYQYRVSRDYLLPFLKRTVLPQTIRNVLEIGCAEAGVLRAFRELGCTCVGVELSPSRTERARELHDKLDLPGTISFINKDIYDIDVERDLGTRFDLIILKDVIEHIHDQERFVPELERYLAPGGVIFFGFPPWQMPFGGHQQICSVRFLRVMPYMHLLPRKVYLSLLRAFREDEKWIGQLMEIKETGISIERFLKMIEEAGFKVYDSRFWLLNPIYKYKFGYGPVRQSGWIARIPWIRNFVTTAAYYLVGKRGR